MVTNRFGIILALALIGCGEQSSAGGIDVDGGTGAGGTTGSAGTTGAAGTTGTAGSMGTGGAAAPSCPYAPADVSSASVDAVFTTRAGDASSDTRCHRQQLKIQIIGGEYAADSSWSRTGYNANFADVAMTTCALAFTFTRDDSICGQERIAATVTLPAL